MSPLYIRHWVVVWLKNVSICEARNTAGHTECCADICYIIAKKKKKKKMQGSHVIALDSSVKGLFSQLVCTLGMFYTGA